MKYKIFKKKNLLEFEIVALPDASTSYYLYVSTKIKEGYNQYTLTVNKFLKLMIELKASKFKLTSIELLEVDTQFEQELNKLALNQEFDKLIQRIEFLDNYEEVDLKSLTYKYDSIDNPFSFKLQNNGVIILDKNIKNIEKLLFDTIIHPVVENDK